MTTLLAVDAVTRRFGGLVAVSAVTLDLKRGEVHAVIGTNGAGKSTLINMLSGELGASSGRVSLDGEDVTARPQWKRARAGIGRSYQRTTIFPEFSVHENCRLAAQAAAPRPWAIWQASTACAASNAAAREALEAAGLAAEARRIAGTLSHGAKRQLEVAMCLATRPRVLLLDEPLAGMGAEETDRMLDAADRTQGLPRHPAGGARHGRRVPHRRPHHGDGQRQRDRHRRPGLDPREPRGAHRLPGRGPLTQSAAMLQIDGLNTYYGDSHILRGVDVDMPSATSLGLLGRNGMGKTTLIRSVMGYVRPAAGRVRLDGHDVTGWAPEKIARRGVGYVPEGRGIFPNLSVRENLVMSARAGPDGRRDWTFDRVMATFPRLSERLSHGGQQLSGGEQQMLAIGRALMTNPRLLILDEATEGLAPLIVAEIWRVIADIRASGIATLIVDRDWRKVLAHTDRAVVMEKGLIVLAAESAPLVAAPAPLAALLGV